MSNFKVVVRVRPLSDQEQSKLSQPAIEFGDDSCIVVHNVKLRKNELADSRCLKKRFYFDKIFWSVDPNQRHYASQDTVYNDLSPDLLDHVFGGYNVCLFAYGQTGSGKTYTMMGNKENPGFIPRMCEGLFDKMSQSISEERVTGENVSFNVSASYIEIYNEKVYDLLDPLSNNNHHHHHRFGKSSKCHHHHYQHQGRHHHHHHLYDLQKALRVREHPKTGPYVEGLSQHTIKDNLQIQKLIKRGNLFRKTASTRAHSTSSRSHAIFSITFTQAKLDAEHPMERRSKINLVDLAGSERADSSSEVDKLRMKEGSDINKSLATLGSVIQALAQRSLLLTWNIPSFSPPPPSSKSSSPTPHRRHGNVNKFNNNNNTNNNTNNNNSSNGSINKINKHQRQVHVPYRDSTLTWILKDSLEGNAVSVMIAAVSPSSCSYFETINTLYYGQKAKIIVNKPVVNEDPTTKLICDLKAEIRRLKTLLSDQQNISVLDRQLNNKSTSFCQVDKSLSTSTGEISELLMLDEFKVNALTRDFLEKWRKMEDADVEVNSLNSSTVEIFTNVPHLISMQDDDDDVDDVGIRIFKLQIGDTIINLSEIIRPNYQDDDGYDDDGGVNSDQVLCIFRNQNNVITIIPPTSSLSSPPTPHPSSFSSSSFHTNTATPPPLPSYPPPPSSSPPPLMPDSSPSLLISDYHSPTSSSSPPPSSSSSFKVYVNDVLITRSCRPKQGDVIRFGKRLKFKFVNPYMTPRRSKRRRRSLLTSHNHQTSDIQKFPSTTTSPSSTILRCSSLTSMPKRGSDPDVSGDFGFLNASDRSCLSDLLLGGGDPHLHPSLSLTWPSFPSDLDVSRDESDATREDKQNCDKHGEESFQFRNEMELQISALEKAWSQCLDKEAELRTNHESNKKDINQRLDNLHTREEKLKSAILSDHQKLEKDAIPGTQDHHSSRNLPKAVEAVENQLLLERAAILRLEKDYKERDEKMFEEVGSMHRQIELLKTQLQALTPKSTETNFTEDLLTRGFFFQQINPNHVHFLKSFPSSNICSPFPSGSNSAIDLRSGHVSRLSKSLDSISVNTEDSLEHSSMETVSSQASLLSPSATANNEPIINASIHRTKPMTNYDIDPSSITIVEDDSKLRYAKRLSPVGSEYENLKEISDITNSPKSVASSDILASNLINVTVTPAIVTPRHENGFTINSNTNIFPTESTAANQQKSSLRQHFHENDSDFSDFSTDSLDHKIHKPATNSTTPTHNSLQNPPKPSKSAPIDAGMPGSDSKGDSGVECSSNGSGAGDGQNGKEEENDFDHEKTACATDVAFPQNFTVDDDNDDDSERNENCEFDVDDEHISQQGVDRFQDILEQDLTTDISDWDAILGRISLPGMPLRSLKALKKYKLKSNSLSNIKTSEKNEVPTFSSVDDELNAGYKEESLTFLNNTDNIEIQKHSEHLTDDCKNSDLDEVKESSQHFKLHDYEQEKLFLEELDAELKKFETIEDDENKIKYFLKGNKLITVVPNQSFSKNNNYFNEELLSSKDEHLSFSKDDTLTDQSKSEIHKTDSENFTLSKVKVFATDMVSSILESLENDESIRNNDNFKAIRENITSPKIFSPVEVSSNVFIRSGSSQRKHVRFNLNDLSNSQHEDVCDLKEEHRFLNKRSSLSLEDLKDLSDESQPGKSEIKNVMNVKGRSEENIPASRNSLELYDFELGRDGRMKMKKHKKRPNLLEIDFVHQSDDAEKDKLEDTFKFDATSKHSIASSDSGVSVVMTPSSTPDQFAHDENVSYYSREFMSDAYLTEESSIANDSEFINFSCPPYLKTYRKEDICLEKNFTKENKSGIPEINEQSNTKNVSQDSYVNNLRKSDQHRNCEISRPNTSNSESYDQSSNTLPDTDASPLSDFESLSTVSVSCDGTDTPVSAGESEESLEYCLVGDQYILSEGINADIDDDIYQTIRSYQSAVARAKENEKLISEKFKSSENINFNLENLLKNENDYHIVHNTLPNDTNKKSARQNQNNNNDKSPSGESSSKKPHVHMENKGTSCDLTEQHMEEAKKSKDRKLYYDKTEVLGFDFYPPTDCLTLNALDQNPKMINLVTGSKSTVCYPLEGKNDKEFEYFGLEPIHEHVEPAIYEENNEPVGDVVVASIILDGETSGLVRCSYDVEIRSNNRKEILNNGDDEDDELVKIINSSEESSIITTAEESSSKTSINTGSLIENLGLSSPNKRETEQIYDEKLLPELPKEILNGNIYQDFDNIDYSVRLSLDSSKSDLPGNLKTNKILTDLNILNSKHDTEIPLSPYSHETTTDIENENLQALEKSEQYENDQSILNFASITSHKTHIQRDIDGHMSSQPTAIQSKQNTADGDTHQYVSELKIFLDPSIDQIKQLKETHDVTTEFFETCKPKNIKNGDGVTILPALQKSQSENICQKSSQPASNLTAMSHLSKSDKDLLGEDSVLFEGLVPTYKQLPKCISGNSKLGHLTEQLESSFVGGVESKDVNQTYETAFRKHLERSDDLLNRRSKHFSVYNDEIKLENGVKTDTPRIERKHSNSLGDLRSPEHETMQKRQGTYDSIDSITLVLVDPGVDEVCGTETKQYLNGHSSLKNISQYGVKIQRIGGGSQDDVLYRSDDDDDDNDGGSGDDDGGDDDDGGCGGDGDDDDEKTIEALHEGEDSEDEEDAKMIEYGDDDDKDDEHDGDDDIAARYFEPYEHSTTYDTAEDDKNNVSCFVLNSDNSIREDDKEHFNLVDEDEVSFHKMNLPTQDDCKTSLKKFSQVLTYSAPIKGDSRTIGHHDYQSNSEIQKHFYNDTPLSGKEEFSKTGKIKSASSHFSIVVNEPQTHVSVYDTSFKGHQYHSSASIRHTDDHLIGYKRTIETQTYPQNRVIETQTSPPLSRKPANSYKSFDSHSTRPTDDVVYHIQSTLNDLDGTQRMWQSFTRSESMKSSDLKDKSFSTETRHASESEASYKIFNNNSTRVTDSEYSGGLQLDAFNESQKSAADENSSRECSPHSHIITMAKNAKDKSKPRLLFANDDKSPHFYTDYVRLSNSMAEVRTCVEDEFMEPYFSSVETLDQFSRSHPIRSVPATDKKPKDDVFGRGVVTPQSLLSTSAKYSKGTSKSSRKHNLSKQGQSPVHDSGMEDRCTNTPIWTSDRGSTSPGAFAIFYGPGSRKDACTNTEDVLRRKTQSLSRLTGSERRDRHDGWKSEINRLRREKRKIIELLAKRVVPSKVQIELSEAQLNYHLGQTDLYLNLLEEGEYPSDVRGSNRSHSVDNFKSDECYRDEINDFPVIKFDVDFLARRCERLETSRKKIEERLSRIESIRVGSPPLQESETTLRGFASSGREETKDVKKVGKRFISAASTPIKISSGGRMFQSHRESSLNSPHYLDVTSRCFDERSSGSDRRDSLRFERTSEEGFQFLGNVKLRRIDQQETSIATQNGKYDDEEPDLQHTCKENILSSGFEPRQEKLHRNRTTFQKSKLMSSSEDGLHKRQSPFRPLIRHGHSRHDDDDDDDYRLLVDCYDARKRAEDGIRVSQEFLEETSF